MSTALTARLTARQAVMVLMFNRWRRNFCLPNYTPRHWWECDLFELTAAGFFREFEVKLTRADFLADRRKSRGAGRWLQDGGRHRRERVEEKHTLLSQGDPRGPTQFWYVAPAGLLLPEDLPAWAGLIELQERSGPAAWRWLPSQVRPAPRLHRQRCDPKVESHARGICYWRMQDLLRGVDTERPLVSEVEVIPTLWGAIAEES